jgi:hypothetical protein
MRILASSGRRSLFAHRAERSAAIRHPDRSGPSVTGRGANVNDLLAGCILPNDRDPECSCSARPGGKLAHHPLCDRAGETQSQQTAISSQPAVAPATDEDTGIPRTSQDRGRERERPLKSPARHSWNRFLAARGLRCSESRSAHSLLEAARGQAEVAPTVGTPHSERRPEVRRIDVGFDGLSCRDAHRPVPIVANC